MTNATFFRNYFSEILPSLNFFTWSKNVTSLINNIGIIDEIAIKFYDNPSIKMINNKLKIIGKFLSRQLVLIDVKKV